jgi:SAM-dependent methyltransferase
VVGVRSTAVAWHDVECASYAADLDLWRELAAAAEGPVLDLGCGTGRVALDLAAHGHSVTAVDADPELVAELARRARERGLRVDTLAADGRTLAIDRRFGLALAAMQVVQLLGGRDGRLALMTRVREHLAPGARFGAALADPFEAVPPADALPPLPDVAEVEGWVLSSRPVDVREEPRGVAVDRLRQLVSPTGELTEELNTVVLESVSADQLEREAVEAGLLPAGRRQVPATCDYVGSTVVIVEAPA